jgi:putative phosphoesterase
MNIGIIADIHADLSALKIALDIVYEQGADMVICAGDLVGKGPYGDQVIELLRAESIPSVLGNHDFIAPNSQKWLQNTKIVKHTGESSSLSQESLDYIVKLPRTHDFYWEGTCLQMAHGTPWSIETYVYPYSGQSIFEDVAQSANADVVVLGHTHEPMVAKIRGTWIVNPGSVCGNFTYGSRTCAVLSLPSCNLKVFDLKSGKRVSVQYVEF